MIFEAISREMYGEGLHVTKPVNKLMVNKLTEKPRPRKSTRMIKILFIKIIKLPTYQCCLELLSYHQCCVQ